MDNEWGHKVAAGSNLLLVRVRPFISLCKVSHG